MQSVRQAGSRWVDVDEGELLIASRAGGEGVLARAWVGGSELSRGEARGVNDECWT